jgi:hypothetical protein
MSLIAAALLIALCIALWVRYGQFWAIDGCLDSGGAWDYAGDKCQH